jgi:hypothetical protein
VPNKPAQGIDWLSAQPGIASTVVLADRTGGFSSSGLIQGELKADLDDAGLTTLIGSVQRFLSNNSELAIRLERNGIALSILTDAAQAETDRSLWNEVLSLGVDNALVGGSTVHSRALRPDAVALLDTLDGLAADLEVEAFRTETDLADDVVLDDRQGTVNGNLLSIDLLLPAGCNAPDQRALAETMFTRDELDGAELQPCAGFELYLSAAASIAAVSHGVRAELDAAGLSNFPVNAHQSIGAYPDGRLVAITPGDAAALDVLDALESPPAPVVGLTLTSGPELYLTEYATPVADLLALVSTSPAAGNFAYIRLEGDLVTIYGPLGELPGLLDEANALAATSSEYGDVQLSSTEANVTLISPVATDPDVVAAAAALRASGIANSRTVTVFYINFEVYIVGGVAEIGNPNYTDGEIMDQFVAAWNAG